MQYGFHVDDPIMGNAAASLQERYRSDVSTTIFLNDDYEGGELIIKTASGEESVKCKAGDAVIYSSNSLHKVNEVTSGIRLGTPAMTTRGLNEDHMKIVASWIGRVLKNKDDLEEIKKVGQEVKALCADFPVY